MRGDGSLSASNPQFMIKNQMDGAQALIKTLDDLGIEYIF